MSSFAVPRKPQPSGDLKPNSDGERPHVCGSAERRPTKNRRACEKAGDTPAATPERAFTIVAFAAPGIPVPFVAAVIDCDGTSVRANLIDVPADPEHVTLGMKVQLGTYSMGTDDNGTEAIGFGFKPIS